MYVITFAKGIKPNYGKHLQWRNVKADLLATAINLLQARGNRIIRVEEQQ